MIVIGGVVVDALAGIAAGGLDGIFVFTLVHLAAAPLLVAGAEMWKNWLTLSGSESPETEFSFTNATLTNRDWEERSPGSPSAPMPRLWGKSGSFGEK